MSGAEPSATSTATHTADTPQLLLEHHLKELRLMELATTRGRKLPWVSR